MSTYLTVITTILVATQIIRVTQNAMHLQKYKEIDRDNKEVLGMWKRMSRDIGDIKEKLESEEGER